MKLDLRKLSSRVAKLPSMGYAFAYLLCIPLFAFVFWLFPDQFYHATSRYEPYLHADADVILKEFTDDFVRDLQEYHKSNVVVSNGLVFRISDITFTDLRAEGGNLYCTLNMNFYTHDPDNAKPKPGIRPDAFPVSQDKPAYFTESKLWIKGHTARFGSLMGGIGQSPYTGDHLRTVKLVEFPDLPGKDAILPYPKRLSDDSTALFIPVSLDRKIDEFENAVNGFPSRTSGSPIRMFYLSAVTITTLGYGDIVPLTGLTRSLIAFEAILGVVLIGLFLTALSYEMK